MWDTSLYGGPKFHDHRTPPTVLCPYPDGSQLFWRREVDPHNIRQVVAKKLMGLCLMKKKEEAFMRVSHVEKLNR